MLDNSGTSLGESLDLRTAVCASDLHPIGGLLPLLKKKAIYVERATLDNDHNAVSVCAETILTPAHGGNSRLYQTMSMQAACQSVPPGKRVILTNIWYGSVRLTLYTYSPLLLLLCTINN